MPGQPPAPGSPLATGFALTALPIDKMISAPLMAAISAQIQASKAYVDFIRDVGMDGAKAVMVPFEYKEDQLDANGNVTGHFEKKMVVPLLALVQHPAMNVDTVKIDFEMEVSTMESTHSMTEGSAQLSAKAGWGPFSIKVSGKVSHKSEQTRKTDTRSKYSFHIECKHVGQTEGMSRVLDALVDSAVQPKKLGEMVAGPASHAELPAPGATPATPADPD